MSRTHRLLDLIQILRRHRYPITGQALAQELGVSLRSLYRDIATLQQQGAAIEGAPGLGYVLRAGFVLPPLMLTEDEIEALVLGTRWVVDRGDARLAAAARDALAKIGAVLPEHLRDLPDESTLLAGPGKPLETGALDLTAVRQAIRAQRKLSMVYCDLQGAVSTRTIWPIALGFFDNARVLVGWCELRGAFRHFRADRIGELSVSDQRYPQRREVLMRAWREENAIARQ